MIAKSVSMITYLLLSLSLVAQEEASPGDFVMLVDALDEPEYYCVDLLGWGRSLQLDDPLQAHTCKTQNADDQMFHFDGNRLKVSKYDRCFQVAGSSGTTLAGSSVLARPCAEDNAQQDVTLDDQGKISFFGAEFCLAAGTESTAASGPSHLWRTLTVEHCDGLDATLSTWQVGKK